ncbi:unnamed protein product [Heligmosomoides polygyrus]|uniref:Protein kinase domain-containing protein n=1 Tax=Heligmosomoides polygyrus TaxID=6339 RepID=A0A183G2H3_HELPZ|nr:unnamed protein product [Heligmosomoides polygyrus]
MALKGMRPYTSPGKLGLGSFGCPMGQVGVPRVDGTVAALRPSTCNSARAEWAMESCRLQLLLYTEFELLEEALIRKVHA